MARAIITPDGVFIEDGTDEFILPSGVFAEDQADVAVTISFPPWKTPITHLLVR